MPSLVLLLGVLPKVKYELFGTQEVSWPLLCIEFINFQNSLSACIFLILYVWLWPCLIWYSNVFLRIPNISRSDSSESHSIIPCFVVGGSPQPQ